MKLENPQRESEYEAVVQEEDFDDEIALQEDSREEISRLAHSYWEADGCVHGRDLEYWLAAEQDVLRRQRRVTE